MVKHLAGVPPELMSAVRDALRGMQERPLEQALELGALVNARARASEAFREAARQFFSMA
jgi:enoyl-CoA hydratase/carnithine racemase